ncbi:MAG: DUF3320 domain-containing protein [Erysipelotrichales bacterium]|nr:DUF3320 domain-containing protein [Erysipelotrichales bacterium]
MSVKIEVNCQSLYSLAFSHNNIPLIKNIKISGFGEKSEEYLLEVTSNPVVTTPFSLTIRPSRKEFTMEKDILKLRLLPEAVKDFFDRENISLSFTLKKKNEIVSELVKNVIVLPYHFWPGANLYPETLLSFINSHHPQVVNVLKTAISLGQSLYKNLAFGGYPKTNPNDILKQVYSLYFAFQKLKISPLSSAENLNEPTKIFFPDDIVNNGSARTLDLALFFAAALEAVKLHPLIILTSTKVLCGVFTGDRCFAEVIQDDFSLLYKLSQKEVSELIIIDPLSLMDNLGFDESEKNALDILKNDSNNLFFLDVFRGRKANFKALPLRIKGANGYTLETNEQYTNRINKLPSDIVLNEKVNLEKNISKYQKWERKLLDLTLNNSLLNMQPNSKTIQIIHNDLDSLYNELNKGSTFKIMPVLKEFSKDNYSEKIIERLKDKSLDKILSLEHSNKRLHTCLDENKTLSNLEGINRQYRLSLEENGYNKLFLAMNSLKWYETKNGPPIYSPLFLLPMEMKENYRESYSIKLTDEGPVFNITLVEMLNKNFNVNLNFIEDLIKQQKEINIKEILALIKNSILPLSNFTVEDTAFLGIFSFNKFMMYSDLRHRRKEIESNKIIKSLLNNTLYSDTIKPMSSEEIDLSQYCIPIAADSSQLEAVINSHAKKSFVLHGPPGTGKSQTITNIIANALYHNKTVLFIAEKQAALNVVDSRLNALGIGDHTLKLHSHKANKKDILSQFENVLNQTQFSIDADFKQKLKEFNRIKDDINLYLNHLHKKNHLDVSFYDAYLQYENLEGADNFFDRKYYQQMTPAIFQELSEMITEIMLINEKTQITDSAFKDVNADRLTYDQNQELQRLLVQNNDAGTQLQTLLQHYDTEFGLGINFNKLSILEDFKKLLNALANIEHGACKYLSNEKYEEIINKAKEIEHLKENTLKLKEHISARMKDGFFPEKAEKVSSLYDRYLKKGSLGKILLKKQINKTMLKYQLLPDKNEVRSILAELRLLDSYKQESENIYEQMTRYFVKEKEKSAEAFFTFNEMLNKLFGVRKEVNFRTKIVPGLVKNLKSELSKINNAINTFFQSLNRITTLLKINFRFAASAQFPETINNVILAYLENFPDLEYYILWNKYRKQFTKYGFQKLIIDFENGIISENDLMPGFLKSYYHISMEMLLGQNQYLYNFKGNLFENNINKYRALFEKYQEYIRLDLQKRLKDKIPPKGIGGIFNDELSVLLRAIRNNSRGLSIRQLFEHAKNIITTLTPCMLMSPSSLAQFINFDFKKFDLVIFDEASQLPTAEVVGAISRGENVIVVGDPKQLPPTTFFTSSISDTDFESEDLESILDDLIAINMPESHLLWHYRSKHESLIAFSNYSFYKNSLLTLPSNDALKTKIKFVKVNGIYDRGNSKVNKKEAQAVVSEVERRLLNPKLAKESIGIVTFNSYQANYIEDLLKKTISKNSKLKAIYQNLEEPLIIKNLENIQGDERDVIMFSVGYGYDNNKRMSLNFGPLNKEGGWRRLNVACTRSRTEMIIFSSIEPDDLRITETTATGVESLKNFLEFAQNPTSFFHRIPSHFESLATNYITKRLKSEGYHYDIHLGSSTFKIDIAIKDAKTGVYLLAVLLDGENYKNIPTTYERNVSAKDNLTRLGWQVINIWLIDFFKNPENEWQKIQQLLSGKQIKTTKEVINEEEPLKIIEIKPKELNTYQNADLPKTKTFEKINDFCKPENVEVVTETIKLILEVEAPISKSLLLRKIANHFGVSVKSINVERYINDILSLMKLRTTSSFDQTFYWYKNITPLKYNSFRINYKGNPYPRTLSEIEPLEIRNALKEIVKVTKSVKRSKLIDGLADTFLISYHETDDLPYLENALKLLENDQNIEINDDELVLKKKAPIRKKAS